MSTEQDEFVYGADEHPDTGTKCPAAAVGYDPSEGDVGVQVASRYDIVCGDEIGAIDIREVPVIQPEQAEEMWKEAIRQYYAIHCDNLNQQTANYDNDATHRDELRRAIEIAEELGWDTPDIGLNDE